MPLHYTIKLSLDVCYYVTKHTMDIYYLLWLRLCKPAIQEQSMVAPCYTGYTLFVVVFV